MSASNMETDQLMTVSRSVLPELNSLPGIFEINLLAGESGSIN